MLFVFLATLIPGLLLGVFVSFQVKQVLTDQALNFQKTLSQSIRKGLTARICDFQEQLAGLVANPEIQSMNVERQRAIMFQFLDHHPIFFSFFIYDREGNTRNFAYQNRFDREEYLLGRNILNASNPHLLGTQKLIKTVLQTGEMAVASKISLIKGRSQLLLLVPIHDFVDPGKVIGVLSSGLNIDGNAIQSLLSGIESTNEGFVVITDGEGTPLLRQGRNLPPGLEGASLSRSLEQPSGESTWTNVGGAIFLVSASRIPELNCFLLVGARRDEVLGNIDRTFGNMLVLTILFAALSAFIGGFIGNSLVDPIQKVLEGIRKVGEGAISHRIDVPGDTEIAETARAFNDLTRKLEKNRMLEDIWGESWKPPS